MKKTFEERMKSKIHQAKKKKLFMRFFRIAYYRFVLMFYYIGLFFAGNAKRFIIALAALMIFALNTSFVELSQANITSYAYALPQNGKCVGKAKTLLHAKGKFLDFFLVHIF